MAGWKIKLAEIIGFLVATTVSTVSAAQDAGPQREQLRPGVYQYVYPTNAQRMVLINSRLYESLNPKKKIGSTTDQAGYSALFVIFNQPRGQVSVRGGGDSISFSANDGLQYWILLDCGGEFVQSDFFDFNPAIYRHRAKAFMCTERPAR